MKEHHLESSDIEKLEIEAARRISDSNNLSELEKARIEYLGRSGKVTSILRSIGNLPQDKRPDIGKKINEIKHRLNKLLEDKKSGFIKKASISEVYPDDYTLPGVKPWQGGRHILHRVKKDIKDVLYRMGYSIARGPDVELDYYNFEALNFPPDHPSRDLQDTFYINRDILLRTQTSPVQVRYMEKNDPPIKIMVPGRVYRCETPDPSHASEFLQMEGLYVDRGVSLADLREDVTCFVRSFFGPDAEIRFRPHFFPFTEPSAEVDMNCFSCGGEGCSVCKKTGWIEIMGAGMVHPHVFEYAGYDPEAYTGFAFGMGIDRIAMLKYGIDDIREFLKNDLRFLSQFWGFKGEGR